MHVLIVDDSRAMRSILSHILRQLGFELSEACNGREALERLAALDRVDLALVDWNMPEMSGIDFVRSVRAESKYDDVRIMMVTTETEAPQVTAALQAGANEYVMKPFTKDVIQEKLTLLGLSCDPSPATA
jgi:two-component system, chemotaxis family, chemotaxis protein CheY